MARTSAANRYADALIPHFPGRLYVEIARSGAPNERESEEALIDLAYARDMPLVATNPALFAEAGFHAAHDAMLCIANSTHIDAEDRPRAPRDAWVKPSEHMAELFADLPEGVGQLAGDRAALRVRAALSQADPAQPCRRFRGRGEGAGRGRKARPGQAAGSL